MIEEEALDLMKAPGSRRPGKWRQGVIQIHVGRACDRACYSCTQGSNLGGKAPFISLQNFEVAVASLQGYFGVVGVFGGNPALHPQFKDLCTILSRYIPFEQRGIWCNHPWGHGKLMAATFNPVYSNLNVHQSQAAYDEFKRDWPLSRPVGLDHDSLHSPVFASMIDLSLPENKRWELISKCDINQHWSAMIGQFRRQPRAWFCEIAGAQSMLHQFDPDYPDTGVYPVPGWWERPITSFVNQVHQHCHNCAVPMRGKAIPANSPDTTAEVTTNTYLPVFKTKRNRPISTDLESSEKPVVDYL